MKKLKVRTETVQYKKYNPLSNKIKCTDCKREYLEINMIKRGQLKFKAIYYCIRCFNGRFYKRRNNQMAGKKTSRKDGRAASSSTKNKQDKIKKIIYKKQATTSGDIAQLGRAMD